MKRGRGPIFVGQRTYRHRRMADAARMLPLLGGLLFAFPLLWRTDEDTPRTAAVMIFLFIMWLALSGIAAVLSRRLTVDDETHDEEQDS